MSKIPNIKTLRLICQGVKGPFYAEKILRRISIFVTWVLLHTSISADQVTMIQMALGVLGSLLVMTAKPIVVVFGVICWHLGYLFDCIDGEVARFRQISTLRGGLFLDGSNHLIVQSLIYFAMGMYSAQQQGGNLYYLFVAVPAAIFSTLPVTAAMKGAVITAIESGNDIFKYKDLASFFQTPSKKTISLERSNFENFLINKVQLLLRYPWNMVFFTFLLGFHLLFGEKVLPLIFYTMIVYSLSYIVANIFFLFFWYQKNEPARVYYSLKKHYNEVRNGKDKVSC